MVALKINLRSSPHFPTLDPPLLLPRRKRSSCQDRPIRCWDSCICLTTQGIIHSGTSVVMPASLQIFIAIFAIGVLLWW